jgi:hypothetical protein
LRWTANAASGNDGSAHCADLRYAIKRLNNALDNCWDVLRLQPLVKLHALLKSARIKRICRNGEPVAKVADDVSLLWHKRAKVPALNVSLNLAASGRFINEFLPANLQRLADPTKQGSSDIPKAFE